MNAKVSTRTGQVLKVVGAAAALVLGAASAFAEPHGGGGHFSGGGGHISAPRFGGRPGGRQFTAAPHYYGGFRGGRGYAYSGAYGGRGYAYGGGYGWRGGYAYGYRPAWGGGYWRGVFWPSAYYGWAYPFYLAALPPLYATYWWGGVPYYYVNNVYYTYSAADNGYVATDPPPVAGDDTADVNAAPAAGPDGDAAAQNGTPPDVAPAGGAGLIAYPRNGQSEQQQSQDKFECHNWAKGQTGFDPTSQASAGASAGTRSAYGRAMAACLEGRGYTVR
jgi:hypothetical protein